LKKALESMSGFVLGWEKVEMQMWVLILSVVESVRLNYQGTLATGLFGIR
jgi:hypothetical protein